MKNVRYLMLYILTLTPTANAESKPDTLEKQIFWSVAAIISDKKQFISTPKFCVDNNCRMERSLIGEQNFEMVFHEIARQANSCKFSLKNDYDFSYKKTAIIVRKMAAIDSNQKQTKKVRKVLENNLSLTSFSEFTCEKALRRLKNLNDPYPGNKESDKIIARNLDIIKTIKPLYCHQFEELSNCMSSISKTKKFEKIKQFALQIEADDSVSQIKISTLNTKK